MNPTFLSAQPLIFLSTLTNAYLKERILHISCNK